MPTPSRRLLTRVVAIAAACTAAFVMATPAASAAPPTSAPVQPPVGHDLDRQFIFEDVVKDSLKEMPDGLVDFVWHGTTGVLTVKSGFESQASDIADRHSADLTVNTARDDAIAWVEQTSVERAAIDIVKNTVTSGNARYDVASGRIKLIVRGADPASTVRAAEQRLASNRSAASLPAIDIEYDPLDSGLELQADVVGGKQYGACTGGFMGYLGSAWGIITAGHCGNASTYDGASRSGAPANAYSSNGYDIQFVPLNGGTPRNKFVSFPGLLTTIDGIGIPAVGGWLYTYGVVSHDQGTTIAEDLGCEFYDDFTICNLYRTTDQVTQHGDSGGPWFAGTHGYGITTGVWNRNGNHGSVLTSLVSVLYIPGVASVKTS